MKVNQLPARALSPNSYAIEGGGSACRNELALRNWTECHHTARCTRAVALFGARAAYTKVLLRFALADFRIGDIYNTIQLLQYAFSFSKSLKLMDPPFMTDQEGRAEFHV
jgi:hypothetical protein